MSKKRKENLQRIMVSMPPTMLSDFREKAQESGLSVSRVIYLRLKSRGPMVLVPWEVLEQTKQLVEIYGRIATTGAITADERQTLRRILDFQVQMVDLGDKTSIVHGKQVKNHG